MIVDLVLVPELKTIWLSLVWVSEVFQLWNLSDVIMLAYIKCAVLGIGTKPKQKIYLFLKHIAQR